MIRPRRKLLVWAALIGVPIATAMSALPGAAAPLAVVVAIGASLAALDAWRAGGGLDEVGVSAPHLLRITQGSESPLELRIENRSPAAVLLRFALALPDALRSRETEQSLSVSPSTSATTEWPLLGLRRGAYRVDGCRLEQSSPWGLWARSHDRELDAAVQVYPDLTEERSDLRSLFIRRGNAGARPDRIVGRGREFEKLREYLPGDAREDVHWKASAKRSELVTKQFQIERTQEIYALVDASRLSGRLHGERSGLDRNLRAALVLSFAASRYGDLFGLVTFDARVGTFLRARGGRQQMVASREALFDLQTRWVSPDYSEIAGFLRGNLRRRSLLVFFTDLSDPAIGEDFLRGAELLGRHHVVIVCNLRSAEVAPVFERPATTRSEVVENLAGHLTWSRLELLRRDLRLRGVDLHTIPHENLAAEAVERYLSVKRRQLL